MAVDDVQLDFAEEEPSAGGGQAVSPEPRA
jgi:hypothetical protein